MKTIKHLELAALAMGCGLAGAASSGDTPAAFDGMVIASVEIGRICKPGESESLG